MDVVWLRVGHLLRRGWRATLFLALLAGLAAGVAMAAVSIGRTAATSFDRFLAFTDPGDLIVTFCPPDMTEVTEESLIRCFTYDAVDEVVTARALPEVYSAGRAAYIGATVSRPTEPGRIWPANLVLAIDPEQPAIDGRPIGGAGRSPDPDAAGEIAVNERLAEVADVGIGDELDLVFWSADEMGAAAADGEQFSGPRVRAKVVGIERNVRDLIARVGTASSAIDETRLSAGSAMFAAISDAGRFGAVSITSADGDVTAARAAIDNAFAGRLYDIGLGLDDNDTDPIAEAIRYEAGGITLFGAITALAAAVFAGQAVSRQSRREWADAPTLRALGMSGRDAAGAALLRGAITGAIAAVVAIGTAVALSTVGPFGTAGRVEVDAGAIVDATVLGLGSVLTLLVIVGATLWPVARQFRRALRRPSVARRSALGAVEGYLPAPAVAGLSMSFSGRGAGGLPTGTAFAGVALAFTMAIGAVGLTASLDALTATPARFGVLWDFSASTAIGDQRERSTISRFLRDDPDVAAAALINGTDASIGDEVAWFQAFEPVAGVDGLIGPVITAGRAPAAIDEVALGSTTMAEQGLSIGDTIELRTTSSADRTSQLTVVGSTIFNDSFEDNPGRGGVVTVDWVNEYADEATPDPFVVRLRPGADVERFRTALEDVATGGVSGPVVQGAIRNVERIRAVPFLLAALVGLLAVASLAHALVLSVRRQRGQLAVLKSLGFRRVQVCAAVACHATFLVVAAAAVGVPLGIIVGRWGWRLVADEVGVASPPTTPLLWLAVIVVVGILIANLVAAYPGWAAARESTARALRVE